MFPFHVSTTKTYLNRLMCDEKHPAAYWIGSWWTAELLWIFWEEKISYPCHDPSPGFPRQWPSCSIHTRLLWMRSILCFTWWPYSSCSEKAYWRNCKKNWLVFLLPSLSELYTVPSNTFALTLDHLLRYKLFTIVCMKIFSQLFQMLCPVVTLIAHTQSRVYQSCGIWFSLVC